MGMPELRAYHGGRKSSRNLLRLQPSAKLFRNQRGKLLIIGKLNPMRTDKKTLALCERFFMCNILAFNCLYLTMDEKLWRNEALKSHLQLFRTSRTSIFKLFYSAIY